MYICIHVYINTYRKIDRCMYLYVYMTGTVPGTNGG